MSHPDKQYYVSLFFTVIGVDFNCLRIAPMVTNSVSSLFYWNILWKEFKGLLKRFPPQPQDALSVKPLPWRVVSFIKQLPGKNAQTDFLAFCWKRFWGAPFRWQMFENDYLTMSWSGARFILKICAYLQVAYYPLSPQIIELLVVIRTPLIELSQPWKAQTLFWMDRIPLEKTPLQSALWLQWGRATTCLQFRMVAGVQPVLQHPRPLTSMENLHPAGRMVKVEDGQIRCMSSKVI